MSSKPVIAILDIGKTNKKLYLFDESYNTVWEKSEVLPETTDEDGDPCEDIQYLQTWIADSLSVAGNIKDLDIQAFQVAAYGASFVHLGDRGEVLTPLYSYLKPYPEQIKKHFYDRYGGELTFSMLTASPVLGSLNSGMQLYRLKNEKKDLFAKIKYSLHLPQWLSWLVTGQAVSEITSIGCHTNLWNFSQNYYHEWVLREGILEKLPSILPSTRIFPCKPRLNGNSSFRLPSIRLAGIGLHDSSAAMIPYLESFTDPFILISTGTWSISMNPFNASPLTSSELQQDCLCYLSFKGRPVKASRIFAGNEHELQVEKMAAYFQVDRNKYKTVSFDSSMVAQLQLFDAPTPVDRSGSPVPQSVFAARDLSVYDSFELAYHQLMIDIIDQQQTSTRLILSDSIENIFVDGGFGNNSVYMHLLAAAFPFHRVYAANISRASAMGAAMAIHEHWNAKALPGDLIELTYFKN